MKLIVLLVTILIINSTASTQTSSDSTKCFTYEQAREIANKLKKSSLCDSISQNQALQIIHFKSVLDKDSKIIALNDIMIDDQKKSINKLNLKLEVSKKLTIIGVPTAVIAGFIAGFIISK